METEQPYDTLVLAGGMTKGFGIVGSLQCLQDRGILPHVRKFVGTSIGAILAYLVCIGYTPIEIMVVSCQKPIFEKMSQIDLVNVMQGNGAMSFHIFQEMLEKMTIDKAKKFLTLSDLHTRYNKELVCCTYNLTLQKPEYLSYHTHPDLPCITALRMSANVPFLFETFVYDDYQYVDGGVADNFPIRQVAPGDVALGIRTIVRAISSDPDKENNNRLLVHFLSILTVPITRVEELSMADQPTPVVAIPLPSHLTSTFHLTNTEKFDMFSIGYETTKVFLHGS
jgi:predicted acylesterase/phospholipase RssA